MNPFVDRLNYSSTKVSAHIIKNANDFLKEGTAPD